jgi:hypothetical protein
MARAGAGGRCGVLGDMLLTPYARRSSSMDDAGLIVAGDVVRGRRAVVFCGGASHDRFRT